MRTIKVKKGISLPITGEISSYELVDFTHKTQSCAVIGPDYIGLKPTLHVKVGDHVKIGQKLLEDKKNPGVFVCAPIAGEVTSINRGDKRAFESLIIQKSAEQSSAAIESYHSKFASGQFSDQEIRSLMQECGIWNFFRTRPYSKTPAVDAASKVIFVTATDNNPLAPHPNRIIRDQSDAFKLGLQAVSLLSPKIFLCVNQGHSIYKNTPDNCETVCFEGNYPAGNVGTHIHNLFPADKDNIVWHIAYQDIIALGKLLETGHIYNKKTISLAGSQIRVPKLIDVIRGTNISDIIANELKTDSDNDVRSGSVFHGRTAKDQFDFLGQYHNQITALRHDTERVLLGWQMPGFDKFSVKSMFLAKALPFMTFPFSNTSNGSERAIVPIGAFEQVFPLDIPVVPMLKALCMGDIETAEKLGCLELDEEDLAVCTFACSGKQDYGPMLRNILSDIEKGL